MNTLVRYEEPVFGLANLFDEFLDDGFLFNGSRELVRHAWPRVDVVENDDSFSIHADVPGIDKNDISISVENRVLTISGEKKQDKKEKQKGRYYYYERSYGSFNRSFALPENVDEKNIEARYTNGTLELTIKKVEKEKPKAIEIKVA
jgi:HSP20 family protein